MLIADQDLHFDFPALQQSADAERTMYEVFADFGRGSQECLIHARPRIVSQHHRI